MSKILFRTRYYRVVQYGQKKTISQLEFYLLGKYDMGRSKNSARGDIKSRVICDICMGFFCLIMT